jgi:predicted dehydrogenase
MNFSAIALKTDKDLSLMKTGIAILGVGRWGIHWVRNFLHHPHAEVIAIVDPSRERLAECKEKFNLDNRVILATDWASVRLQKNIDGIVVATPASTHYDLIADALTLGYHVLAEKPLTLDPSECLELTHLAAKQQRQLFVDHTYLFHPAVERGQQLLRSQQLGNLRYGYASRTHLGPVRQDVDALWDLAIHDLAIFNYWLGEIPIQVQAKGNIWLQKGLADLVWVTLIYPSGFQAYIHLCWLNTDKQRRLCIVGEQGSLIFDEMSKDAPLTLQKGTFQRQDERFIPINQACEVLEIDTSEPLKKVCDRFLQNIQTQATDPLSSGLVGTQLVQILNCLSLSLQQQGAVVSVINRL